MSEKIKRRITKGMQVRLITGDREYRGKDFKVLEVFDNYVILDGYKQIKKFVKPTQEDPNTTFKMLPKRVHISNVAAIDSQTKAISKITYKQIDGKKTRVLKKTQNILV
jgi:large subunit ribosomal protein L24